MPRPERPVDPEGGVVQRFAVELRELRQRVGSPGYRELARRAHFAATTLAQAARGDRLPSLAVTLAYVQACGGDTTAWEQRWRATVAELDPASVPGSNGAHSAGGRAPYVGLGMFAPEDRDRFFGRERLTARLVDRLARQRLVAVVGASGAGKSSLLRAGLLPAVRAKRWSTLLVTPGEHPMRECAGRLAVSFDEPGGLGLAIRRAMAKQPAGTEFLLVVDQFEEIFTLCTDPAERESFVAELLSAADSACRVVLGIRADFYGHCAQHRELADALDDAQVLVGPMSTDELREAITQPAIRAGCAVETALVARLMADAADRPGVLPLLSHALLETWKRRRGNALTVAGYEATGGIRGAIALSAENVYCGLTPARQRLARVLFLRLIALGDATVDTRRRIPHSELDLANPDTATVLEHLAAARLITLGQDSVELSHEALIRSWPRLAGWLEDDREGLRVHRQLTEATSTWQALNRDPDACYRGTRLARARDWALHNGHALTPREREFLDASLAGLVHEQRTARRRVLRRRQLLALLGVLVLVAGTALVFAARARLDATNEHNAGLAQKLIRDADAMRDTNPALAAQLTLVAHRLAPTSDTTGNLLSALGNPYATRLTGFVGAVNSVSVSADGHVLATTAHGELTRLWDISDPHRPRALATLAMAGFAVQFAPQGHLLAVLADDESPDGAIALWDTANPKFPIRFAVNLGRGTAFAFSPVAPVLAAGDLAGQTQLWNIADPRRPVRLATVVPPVSGVAEHGSVSTRVSWIRFSPNGHLLATAGVNRTVQLWDVTEPSHPGPPVTLPEEPDCLAGGAFSVDGRRLATGCADLTVRLWDVGDPAHPSLATTLHGQTGGITALGFSPDGSALAAVSVDHTVRLWDVATPGPPAVLTGHTGGVVSLAFTPDGKTLLTGSDDNTVRLWDITPFSGRGADLARAFAVAFSNDGATMAVFRADEQVDLWNVADQRNPVRLGDVRANNPAIAAAFSADGKAIAAAGDDGSTPVWDLSDPSHPKQVSAIPGYAVGTTAVPRGPVIATSSRRSVRPTQLWDIGDPHHPRLLVTVPSTAVSVSYSAKDQLLVTADVDHKTRLWDVHNAQRPLQVGEITGSASAALSPAGPVLVATNRDGSSRIFYVGNPGRPTELATLPAATAPRGGPDPEVEFNPSLSFSSDGHTLATIGGDNTARLWDLRNPSHPAEIAALTGHATVSAVQFSPDGHTLVTAGDDYSLHLWETNIEQLVAHICAIAYPRITPAEWAQYLPGVTYQPPCP
jgi:WD40 repeat protein